MGGTPSKNRINALRGRPDAPGGHSSAPGQSRSSDNDAQTARNDKWMHISRVRESRLLAETRQLQFITPAFLMPHREPQRTFPEPRDGWTTRFDRKGYEGVRFVHPDLPPPIPYTACPSFCAVVSNPRRPHLSKSGRRISFTNQRRS
jgi:hypothetical protein